MRQLVTLVLCAVITLTSAGVPIEPDEERRTCQQPTAAACDECNWTRNPIGYVRDPCAKCSPIYYQCKKREQQYTLYPRNCANCTCWDHESLTCVRDHNSKDAMCHKDPARNFTTTGTTCTENGQTLEVVPNDRYNYYMHGPLGKQKMPCAQGTHFSVSKCTCDHGGLIVVRPAMCLNFDGSSPFVPTPYAYVSNVDVRQDAQGVVGSSAYFNGDAYLEIPMYSNKEMPEWSTTFWYNRESLSTRDSEFVQMIMSNQDCTNSKQLASIRIRSLPTVVGGGLRTNTDQLGAFNIGGVVQGSWHHVAMTFDGSDIRFYVDGALRATKRAPSMIAGVHCPLRIGSGYNEQFFRGWIDELCFYDKAIDTSTVSQLYTAGGVTTSTTTTSTTTSTTTTESPDTTPSGDTGSECPTKALDCWDIQNVDRNTASGVYCINIAGRAVDVFCNMTVDGGGYTAILRRFDGTEDFGDRTWVVFKNGIGNAAGEYYLGNENIHQLVSNGRQYELRIDLESEIGNPAFIQYSSFLVNNEADKYRLSLGNVYPGNTLVDKFSRASGEKFSTIDQDNDSHSAASVHCADVNVGGWWYWGCEYCKLTSGWGPGGTQYNRMRWWGYSYSWIRKASMMVRPVMQAY